MLHHEHHWIFKSLGKLIVAEAHRIINIKAIIKTIWTLQRMDPFFFYHMPILHRYLYPNQWHFYIVLKGLLLLLWQLGTQIWNDAIVASKNALLGMNFVQSPLFCINNFDSIFCIGGRYHSAVQADIGILSRLIQHGIVCFSSNNIFHSVPRY